MKHAVFILTLVLLAGLASGQERGAQSKSLSTWIRTMMNRLEHVRTSKDSQTATGVAGVRGAQQEEKSGLYWKGKDAEQPVAEQELKEFSAAIEKMQSGDNAASRELIQKFMNQYPDSALIPDAKKAMDMLAAEGSASPVAK